MSRFRKILTVNRFCILLIVMIQHFTLGFVSLTIIIFLGLFYLYLKHPKNMNFLYASIPFLCGAISLYGQFELSSGVNIYNAIFWTKFKYIGVFGYIFSFPLFMSSVTKKKMSKPAMIVIGIITLIYLGLTFSSNFIIRDKIHYYAGTIRAETGILYPFFMIVFFAFTLYHYAQMFTKPSTILSKQFNYKPLVVGLALAIILGAIDVIGVASHKPVIPGIAYPFIFATMIFSLAYMWTFFSQYSWIFDALHESERKIMDLVAKSDENVLDFVKLIAKTLDAKDHYTAGHSLRVMNYAVKIAHGLKLPKSDVDILTKACLLHDIGKIGIPDGILNKKTPLTEEERQHIINHPVLGKQILSAVSEFNNILEIIYAHHERVDGAGYPCGLKRNEIPLLARVLAVADSYDAMLSERPYRKAKTEKEAILELTRVRGSQLDPIIVDKFIKILQN
jgi:putative nucleotidyltransferase with HDIG domain